MYYCLCIIYSVYGGKMKKLLFLSVMLLFAAVFAVDPCGVGYDDKASPVEKKAANELISYLSKITGQKFKKVSLGEARFLVGHKFVRDKELGNEGIRIFHRKGVTFLGGGTADGRGNLYAVYEYLEKCGVRFWAPNEEYIPKLAVDKLPAVNLRHIPTFPVGRYIVSAGLLYGDPKQRSNGTCSGWWTNGKSNPYHPEGGILSDFQPYNGHTLMYFIPGEKYGKTHPEWFGLIGGKRVTTRRPVPGQLCMSNLEMQKEFVKNVKEYLKKHGKPGTIITIGREDNLHVCECAECTRQDKEEVISLPDIKGLRNTHKYGHTGAYIRFVNNVAKELEKDYPDLKVIASAYGITGMPVKNIHLNKNVIVSMAYTCNLADPEFKDPNSKLYFTFMDMWKKLAPGGLMVCDYGSTFDNYLFPLPNFDAMANRIRRFKANNVVCIYSINAHNTPGGGEFGLLRNYINMRLYWDCNLDPWALAKEFCLGYYGKGGIHLYNYIKWYHNYLLNEKNATYYMGGNPERLYDKFYVDKAKDYFKKAYAESGNDPVFRKRLDHAYVSIDCIDMIQRKKAGDNSPERIEAVKKFEASCNRFKFTRISEKESMKDFLANLKLQVPTPEFCKNVQSDKWFAHLPSCYPYWNWCDVVDDNDPESYSKRPVKMNTNHVAWAVYKKCEQLPGAVIHTGTYDAYAYVKVIHQPGANPEAEAFKFGWYDAPNRQDGRVKMKDMPDGKYTYIKIASDFTATLSGQVWVAPLNNPKIVKNFYVDHFIFVRKD